MKPLTIITILLIVVANATVTYFGIDCAIMDRSCDRDFMAVAAERPHPLHLMPMVGSVALVGVSLLMSGTRRNAY